MRIETIIEGDNHPDPDRPAAADYDKLYLILAKSVLEKGASPMEWDADWFTKKSLTKSAEEVEKLLAILE